MAPTQRQVVLVAHEGMQLLDLIGPAEIFDVATRLLRGSRGYRLLVATPDGRSVRGAAGMRLGADAKLSHLQRGAIDTLVVGGGGDLAAMGDATLVAELRRLAPAARRTCAVCTGAFPLAAAGLLEGRRATTHWAFCRELERRHPSVDVLPDRIFVRDGEVTTSAGVTAGMDLALALVEEDHGPDLARSAARWTVMFLQRPGGQSQFSERLALPRGVESPIRKVVDRIVSDPAGDYRQAVLAARAAMSERNFRRRFAEQTGTTPARFVERVRVEAARELLEATSMPAGAIATRCGFGSDETMRRAFHRILGVTPGECRARFGTASAAAVAG